MSQDDVGDNLVGCSPPPLPAAPREVHFALTPRDLEILQIVESFRLLTSAHIEALVRGSNQGILRRLQKLFHGGYVDRLPPPRNDGGGSAKMIYAITNRGFRELQKAGLIEDRTKTDWNAQNRDLGDLFIPHTLLVSHFRAVLEAACRARPGLELLFWKEAAKSRLVGKCPYTSLSREVLDLSTLSY